MIVTPRRIALGAAVVLVVAVAVWFFVLPRARPHIFSGTVIQSTERVPRTELQAGTGETIRFSDFAGKVVVVYFGYTYCPDVCPATLNKLADAVDILGDAASDVQVIMVSVDPERDTPERLAEYVGYFNPDFIGATGDEATVNRVATLFGVYYEKQESTGTTGYTIDHTATVMLVDREGYLKLVLPFEGTAEQIASDIEYFI